MKNFRNARGFSLIELMIGVALGLVILAALTTFFVSSSTTRNEIERTSRQIENGRFGVNELRDEIHLAGFFAELQTSGATWQTPDPCVNSLPGMGLALGPPLLVPLAVYGYPADTAAPSCIVNRVPGTDVIVLRRFHTEPVAVAAAAGNEYYFQPSRCRSDSTTTPWAFGTGAGGAFGLRKLDCATPADLYRWRVNIFYVRDYSFTPGDGVPTLVKLELDPTNPAGPPRVNNGIATQPIAEGIAGMRIEYGIDNDGDGAPDDWRRCDTTTPCDLTQWPNVTAVRVHLLAVNLEDTLGYTDVKEYDMGTGATAVTSDPAFVKRQKHVYAAVISVPNRTGPRE
jgi:type IV pilus assembly protein PilW